MAFSITHTVLFMRHPQTVANTRRFFSGRGDVDITETGRAECVRAVEAGVAFAPDRVWTSPLRRCHAIADPVAKRVGTTPESHDSLIELDFGELEGTSFSDGWVSGLGFPWPVDEDGRSRPVAGGESFEDAYTRARALFDELRPLSGRTMCVTHGGFLRVILGAAYGMALDRFWYVHLDNVASVTMDGDGRRFYLTSFGLTPEEVVTRYGTGR